MQLCDGKEGWVNFRECEEEDAEMVDRSWPNLERQCQGHVSMPGLTSGYVAWVVEVG
jgi:hypothetical protein